MGFTASLCKQNVSQVKRSSKERLSRSSSTRFQQAGIYTAGSAEGVSDCADAYTVAAISEIGTGMATDQSPLHCVISAPQLLCIGTAKSIIRLCAVRRSESSLRLSDSRFAVDPTLKDLSDWRLFRPPIGLRRERSP